MSATATPSYQSLFIETKVNGLRLATGTAFVVDTPTKGPHLITNRHIVTGRNNDTNVPLSSTAGIPTELVVFHNYKGNLGLVLPIIEQLYIGEIPRWIEHPSLGPKADFVALPLTELDGVDLFPHDPFNSNTNLIAGPAEVVSVVGFPFGMKSGKSFAIWATGFLASEPDEDFDNLPIQLIDCRSRPGQSGSPVLAYRAAGEGFRTENGGLTIDENPNCLFVGIYSGRINEKSDLGMVWKASAICDLIRTL